MYKTAYRAIAVCALELGAMDAEAAGYPYSKTTPWTVVMSTCGWEEGTENLINTGTSDYQYNNGTNSQTVNSSLYPGQTPKQGTKIKALAVRCNILSTTNQKVVPWNTLSVGYEDPDGSGTTSQVLVSVYEIDPQTGNATTVDAAGKDVPFVVFDSNVNGNGATDANQASVEFKHSLNFSKYNYVLVSRLYNTGNDATNPDIWTSRLDKY